MRESGRRWLTDDDMWDVIQVLRAYLTDHPLRTAEEAVKALGLPDMDGVPADPGARSARHRRMARQAREVLHHARYAVRMRDLPPMARNDGM